MTIATWVRTCMGLMVAACGGGNVGDDVHIHVGDAAGTQGDAGLNAVDTIQCQVHTHVVTAADGSRTEVDTLFALIDGIDPLSEYTLELCDYDYGGVSIFVPSDPACPAGATCSSSGAAFPSPTHVCTWESKTATFFDDRLYINCGTKTRTFNSAGTMTGTGGGAYASIRLHH